MDIPKGFIEYLTSLNTDKKEIGDRVKLTDPHVLAYLIDAVTEKQLKEAFVSDFKNLIKHHEDLLNNEAIVSKIDINFEYLCGNCDDLHEADIEIYYPHNKKKYYCKNNELKKV